MLADRGSPSSDLGDHSFSSSPVRHLIPPLTLYPFFNVPSLPFLFKISFLLSFVFFLLLFFFFFFIGWRKASTRVTVVPELLIAPRSEPLEHAGPISRRSARMDRALWSLSASETTTKGSPGRSPHAGARCRPPCEVARRLRVLERVGASPRPPRRCPRIAAGCPRAEAVHRSPRRRRGGSAPIDEVLIGRTVLDDERGDGQEMCQRVRDRVPFRTCSAWIVRA